MLGPLSRTTAAICFGLASSVATFILLWEGFLSFQRWYQVRFVKPIDPDPTFLPFESITFLLFPLLATFLGGIVGGLVYGKRSTSFSFSLGAIYLGLAFAFIHKHLDVSTVLFFLLNMLIVISGSLLAAHFRSGKTRPLISRQAG